MNRQDLDSEIEIIKWAAAAPSAELPHVGEINEERLLGLLWQHRLGMRFQERSRESRPPWCTRTMSFSVMQQCRAARESVRRQLALNAEVLRKLPDCAPFLITIKGASTYALTGCERNIHSSGDTDFMYHDMPQLHSALREIGFQGDPYEVPAHEYSVLARGDMKIEPHIYFPVFCYPSARLADAVPANHPGWWVQNTSNCLRRRITYSDVVAQCQHGNAPGTAQMIVPNPSMAVLIHCAHEFREYLQRPCRLAMIQLNTLADIRDLVDCKGFNPDIFMSLVQKFDGGDSVQLVRMLMRDYFGEDPFPFLPSDFSPARRSLPQFLSYDGAWVQLDEKPDDLLAPLSMEALFRKWEPNIVEATSSAIPKTYGGLGMAGDESLSRIIIQTLTDAQLPAEAGLPLQISAEWGSEGLALAITLQGPLEENCNYHMKLYSCGAINVYHNASLAPSQEDATTICQLKQTDNDKNCVRLDGAKCRVEFALPLSQLPKTWREAGYAQATLVVLRRRGEEHEKCDPVMGIPLHIIKAQC